MIINTFSYLWQATAIDAIVELAAQGHTTFEVPISSPHCWPQELGHAERTAIKARLDDCGASIRSLNAGGYDLNLASPARSMRAKSIEHIRAVMDLALAWGATEIVVSPGTRRPMISPPLDLVYGWMYESMHELVGHAKQAGIRLLMENTPYCFTPTLADLVAVANEVDDDALKIVFDIANAAFIEDDPVPGLLAHHEAIGLIHVSDTGTDVWGHDPIGTGVVDWEGLGKAVETTVGIDNVVLEIIRPEKPAYELALGLRALQERGWQL